MLRKSLGISLIAFLGCSIIYAQKTPDAPQQPAKTEKPTVWTFGFESPGTSYLGVEVRDVTKENFGKYGLREVRGAAVEKVVENSPAAQAGLQANDVIIKFDGEEITSVRKLTRLVSEIAPDHQVKITILRGGDERDLTATMGKRETPAIFNGALEPGKLPNIQTLPKMPDLPNMPRVEVLPPGADGDAFVWKNDGQNTFFFGSNRQIGVSVSSLTKQLGDYFGTPESKGLLITNVRENSPAAKAGLKAGDIIIEADGKQIGNNTDLMRALNNQKSGDVQLTIIRDRNRQTVTVTPEKSKTNLAPLFDETAPQSNLQLKIPQMQTAPFKGFAAPVPMRRVL